MKLMNNCEITTVDLYLLKFNDLNCYNYVHVFTGIK